MTENSFIISMGDILEATGGTLLREGRTGVCRDVSTDSRAITRDALFIPLAGTTYDGHDFIENAAAEGAAAVILARTRTETANALPPGPALIAVDDTLRALGDMAHWWRKRFREPIIAVTGSSGKTTTKEMIASIGSISLNILKNTGNLNNCIGVPMSLLQLRPFHKAGVFELGSNRPGEIARLAEIAHPDVAVITNIGPAHLQGFETIDAVREEKGSIFSGLKQDGLAVINRDDANIRILEDRWRGKSISFGIIDQATVRGEHIFTRGDMGVSFTLKIGGLSRGIDMTTLGIHNIYNALAAAAAAWVIGIPFEEICGGLAAFQQVPGRMTVRKLSSGATLIDDSYNANPASVSAALKTLATVKGNGRSVVIFGDMLELGNESRAKHEEAGRLMAATAVDRLFLTGDHAADVAEGAREGGMEADRIQRVNTPEEVVAILPSILCSDLWILVKGSRGMKMERFVEVLRAGMSREGSSSDPREEEKAP